MTVDESLCICWKIGINYNVCSVPIPNTKCVIELTLLSRNESFVNVDLKIVYHQIQMDGKFEEVTMINTLIGLLRRTRMPYGIKTASAISKSDGR